MQAVPPASTHPSSTRSVATSRMIEADCQTSLGQHNRLWRAVGMEGLSVGSVLLTGCDGGLGLGLLKGLLEQPSPPRHLFAACLDPQGKVRRAPARAEGQERQLWDGCLASTIPRGTGRPSASILHNEWHGKIHVYIYI